MTRIGVLLTISLACCGQQPGSSGSPTAGATLRLHTVSIMDDPRHIAGEAYRVLAPVDWRVEGSIMWRNAAKESAAPWVRLIGPAKQEIGVLPPIAFIWNPQMQGPRYRPGTFLAGIEIQPPLLDPVQCVKTIIISRYLRELGSADVVSQEALPEVVEAGKLKYAGPQYKDAAFQAGKMRFEFLENGVAMQEDVYVLTVAVQVRSGQSFSTLWAPDEIRYSKAPKGALDAQVPLFQTALFSLQPTLGWWANFERLVKETGRLEAQTSAAGLSPAIQNQIAAADRAATLRRPPQKPSDLINDEVIQAYRNHQAVMNQINARWEPKTRGIEIYKRPTTSESVALPVGYSEAWASKTGEYVLTSNHGFDPNSAAAGSWTKLEKFQPR